MALPTMPETSHKPIVDEEGELNLGRHATLWHVDFGALDRDVYGMVPTDAVRFVANDVGTRPKVLIEYRIDELKEAWEDTLFESPIHAEEVATDG